MQQTVTATTRAWADLDHTRFPGVTTRALDTVSARLEAAGRAVGAAAGHDPDADAWTVAGTVMAESTGTRRRGPRRPRLSGAPPDSRPACASASRRESGLLDDSSG